MVPAGGSVAEGALLLEEVRLVEQALTHISPAAVLTHKRLARAASTTLIPLPAGPARSAAQDLASSLLPTPPLLALADCLQAANRSNFAVSTGEVRRRTDQIVGTD